MTRACVVSLVVLGVLLAPRDLNACGDKFPLIGLGRGLKYQHTYVAAHPANLLVYSNPGSGVPAAARDLQLSALLVAAGHTLKTVGDVDSVRQELRSKPYDVVLADVTDGTTGHGPDHDPRALRAQGGAQ